MSERAVSRVLARLAAPDAVLAPLAQGGFGVFPNNDRRRRPIGKLSDAEARDLAASGALAGKDRGGFVLTEAGRARLRRDAAPEEERYQAQHHPIVTRAVMDPDGGARDVRALEASLALKRLSALRDGNGAPWLSADELAAAVRLRRDWSAGQMGLVRGSDWTAAPPSSTARGAGNAQEGALAVHCDARARVADALASLAAPLRRVVERVCLHEQGLELLERQEGWPARSGKIALKLGLAQLAGSPVYRRA